MGKLFKSVLVHLDNMITSYYTIILEARGILLGMYVCSSSSSSSSSSEVAINYVHISYQYQLSAMYQAYQYQHQYQYQYQYQYLSTLLSVVKNNQTKQASSMAAWLVVY